MSTEKTYSIAQSIKEIPIWKLLNDKNKELARQAEQAAKFVESHLECYKILFPHYTDHSIRHSFNVMDNMYKLMLRNIAVIKQSVSESDAEKIVVVTHHLPTFAALDERHKGSVLNTAYATELGNYIADSRISAWIYGHSHHCTDLMIGNTHLVSNPLGYVFCGENTNFNDSAVIEI